MHFDFRKIRHIRSAIDISLIDDLYESAISSTVEPATVGKIVNGQYTTEYNKWCTANFVNYTNFKHKVGEVVSICKSKIENYYNVTCLEHEINFLHYGSGAYYTPHIDGQYIKDNIAMRGIDRDITCVVYLNDEYLGGEINFDFFKYTVKPNKSDILIYPTTFEFVHNVNKVEGNRYAIVMWFKTNPMMNVDTVITNPSIVKFLQRATSV